MKKIILLWSMVIIWMGVIFYLSSMDTGESNGKSREVITKVVDTTVDISHAKGEVSPKSKEKMVDKLNKPLRKCAHASVYFILAILILNALLSCNNKHLLVALLTISLCFIYACTDEYHQTFVSGRTGQFSDVLIDTMGSVVACLVYYRIKKRRIVENN